MKKRKREPMRLCLACRQMQSKKQMVRVVRQVDGTICIDPTGKLSGRGAYMCLEKTCVEKALQPKVIAHALKTAVTTENIERIRKDIDFDCR